MMNEEWKGWERRARLWTKVHATIPESMKKMVEQVRRRDSGADDCVEQVEKGKAEDRGEKKNKDEKTADKITVGTESNVPRVETAMTPTVPRKLAAGTKKQKSANASHPQNQKRTNSTAAPSPITTPDSAPSSKRAEAVEKDKDRSVEKDCANQGDENAELENTPGKENAAVSPAASTPIFNPALPSSRSTSPVKSQTPPPALVALPGMSVSTATSPPQPPSSISPGSQTKPASSRIGKKRPSGDELNPAHESAVSPKMKLAKLAAISSMKVSPAPKPAHIKSSSSASASSSSSSASSSASVSKAGMKKKVVGTSVSTTPKAGTQVQARKGLKRF